MFMSSSVVSPSVGEEEDKDNSRMSDALQVQIFLTKPVVVWISNVVQSYVFFILFVWVFFFK